MLGAAFAQTVYIAYNATRDGNDTIGFAPRPGSNTLRDSRMSAGAVAGISVGATVGFFLCLLLFYLWWRAKRAVRVINYTEKDGGSKSGIEPYTPLTATSPAFKPMGSPGLYSATTPGFSATSPGFTLSPSGNGHSSEQDRHQYVIEQGPIGGDVVGVAASVPSSVTPESSPRSTMLPPAHRRKAEEAGLLAPTSFTAAALAARRGNRPPSQGESVSNVTSTDYLHNLVSPGGVTTSTGLMGQGGGALPSTPGSQIYHPGDAIPQTQSTQQHVTHQSSAEPLLVRNGTPANASTTVSTPPPTSSATPAPSSMDTRHQSTATNLMSPTSPHQIHYHIHIAPGASATNFPLPPGSIIHEYSADEPAPEYSERPGSMSMSMDGVETHTHTHVTTPPHTGTSTHFAS
ncbi:hypothetical protein FRC14_000755 [Serendipita sp. 396]|nr:hypothetical protein FRC14_000755 [Serendipita sp. 396]